MFDIGDKVVVCKESESKWEKLTYGIPKFINRKGIIVEIITHTPIAKEILEEPIYIVKFNNLIPDLNQAFSGFDRENKWSFLGECLRLQS